MLSKPSEEFYRSLLVLTRQPAWDKVEKALRIELQALYETMRDTRDVVGLHQMQGQAQFLSGFLKTAAEAPKTLDKLTKGRM